MIRHTSNPWRRRRRWQLSIQCERLGSVLPVHDGGDPTTFIVIEVQAIWRPTVLAEADRDVGGVGRGEHAEARIDASLCSLNEDVAMM